MNLCSGIQDQTDAQFSSETICLKHTQKSQHSPFWKLHFVLKSKILGKDQTTLLPFKLVFFVSYVIGLIVVEKIGDPCGQVVIDAVHVARRGHDGTHVFVTVLDTLLHLNTDIHTWLSNRSLALPK